MKVRAPGNVAARSVFSVPARRRRFALLLPLAALLPCGGCAGLTGATLGTVAGAIGSAVGTGKDIYGLGKLDTVEMTSLAEAREAVVKTGEDLHLKFRCETQEEDHTTHLTFFDDKCAKIRVRIEPRTSNLVRVRIDVGIFGSEPTARLFVARVRTHLPAAANPVPREPAS